MFIREQPGNGLSGCTSKGQIEPSFFEVFRNNIQETSIQFLVLGKQWKRSPLGLGNRFSVTENIKKHKSFMIKVTRITAECQKTKGICELAKRILFAKIKLFKELVD